MKTLTTTTYLFKSRKVVPEKGHWVTGSLYAQLHNALFEKALHLVLLAVCLTHADCVLLRASHLHVHTAAELRLEQLRCKVHASARRSLHTDGNRRHCSLDVI